MKQTLVTVNFSVDRKVQEELDQQAAEEGRSKSDIFREMYRQYRFNRALQNAQAAAQPLAMKYGLETDDDVERFMHEH